MTTEDLYLTLDTASPEVSVAVGRPGRLLAFRSIELRRSSELLLRTIEECLADAKTVLDDLAGVAVLQGPGSFTGLRVGLATALGLHQSLGVRATALPTLPILGASALRLEEDLRGQNVTAAVDAMRGEWLAQGIHLGDRPEVLGPPRLLPAAQLLTAGRPVVGFGVSKLVKESPVPLIEPPPLAPVAIGAAAALEEWDPGELIRPIYFRAPAVTPSKKDPAPPELSASESSSPEPSSHAPASDP